MKITMGTKYFPIFLKVFSVVLIPQNKIVLEIHDKYQKGFIFGFYKMSKKYHRNTRQMTEIWNLPKGSYICLLYKATWIFSVYGTVYIYILNILYKCILFKFSLHI